MPGKSLICGAVGTVVLGAMHWMGLDLVASLVIAILVAVVVGTMVIQTNPNDHRNTIHDNSGADGAPNSRSSVDSSD